METLFVFVAGLCFGSFITLASYRLPLHQDIFVVPSRCTACGKSLRARDLVPVLSWFWNGRKCRFCRAPVHWRYPAIELATGGVFVLLYHEYGFSGAAAMLALLAVALLVMIVADLEHYTIPDPVHYVLLPAGLLYRWLQGAAWLDIAGGLLLGLSLGLALRYGYRLLHKKDGLGLGDVKFLASAGLWLGAEALVPFLFLSGVLGIGTALLWRLLDRGKIFPFGPALAVALFLCVALPDVPAAFWNLQRVFYR